MYLINSKNSRKVKLNNKKRTPVMARKRSQKIIVKVKIETEKMVKNHYFIEEMKIKRFTKYNFTNFHSG